VIAYDRHGAARGGHRRAEQPEDAGHAYDDNGVTYWKTSRYPPSRMRLAP
jgi:hypothetical protein